MQSNPPATRKRGRREYRLTRLITAVEARVRAYNDYLKRVGGPLTQRGTPRKCLDRLERDENRLLALYDRLEGRHDPLADDPLAQLLRQSRR